MIDMRVSIPGEFLDTLGVNRTEDQIIKDFSDCLVAAFEVLDQPDQPAIWKHLMSNTSLDISQHPNAIESNGAVVAMGMDILQQIMVLPPEKFVKKLKQILEDAAKLSSSQILGHPFEPQIITVVGDKALDGNSKDFNKIRHQQAYHAITHGWFPQTIAYKATSSDKFNQALERSWSDEKFDDVINYYVNALVEVTYIHELSGSFHLRFFIRKMIKKLAPVAPAQMLDPSGNLNIECIVDIAKRLCGHPKMPKYGIDAVKRVNIAFNTTPQTFLAKTHEKYLEMQTIQKQLWVEEDKFWMMLRSNLKSTTPLDAKNALVKIIKSHYASPKSPLVDRYIAILSLSPYVLKQLFAAGVLATQNNQNTNVVDGDAKKYSVYNSDKEFSLKEYVVEFLSSDDHPPEELEAAQDLLNIFQRTTLVQHIAEAPETHTLKNTRKM